MASFSSLSLAECLASWKPFLLAHLVSWLPSPTGVTGVTLLDHSLWAAAEGAALVLLPDPGWCKRPANAKSRPLPRGALPMLSFFAGAALPPNVQITPVFLSEEEVASLQEFTVEHKTRQVWCSRGSSLILHGKGVDPRCLSIRKCNKLKCDSQCGETLRRPVSCD